MKVRETYVHRHDCDWNGKEFVRTAPVKDGVYYHVPPFCPENHTELELVRTETIKTTLSGTTTVTTTEEDVLEVVRSIARDATESVRRQIADELGEAKPTGQNVLSDEFVAKTFDDPEDRPLTLQELRDARPWEPCNFEPVDQHLCKRHVQHEMRVSGLFGQKHA